eukprot:Awhi_evm2s4538
MGLTWKTKDLYDPKILFSKDSWRGYAAEFVGMIFFLFVTIGVVQSQSTINYAKNQALNAVIAEADYGLVDMASVLTIAFAFGITIMVMAYSLGHISGGHFNPAVTMAFMLSGLLNPVQGLIYIFFQTCGAIIGCALVYACWPRITSEATKSGLNGWDDTNDYMSTAGAFFAEFLGTALLCFVVFGVAVDERASKYVKHMAPLAIGFTVFLSHIVLIPITGCGINPARSTASAVVATAAGNGDADQLWLYWIAPLIGGPVGAGLHYFFFNFHNDADHDPDIAANQRGDLVAGQAEGHCHNDNVVVVDLGGPESIAAPAKK